MEKIAIQDTYGEKYQHCWGCGAKNEKGLQLKSYPSEDGSECICKITPAEEFTGGVPDNLFGGMIAMIFDCHGTASAAWFSHHNKGLDFNKDTVIERFITARLEVDYKKPLPMGKEIMVTSSVGEIGERKIIVNMQMEAEEEVRARAVMVAVSVNRVKQQ